MAQCVDHAFETRGDVDEAVHWRAEAELHFELPGGGYSAEGASVKRAVEGDDLVTPGAVFAGEFVETFVGFGAAVAKKDFSR